MASTARPARRADCRLRPVTVCTTRLFPRWRAPGGGRVARMNALHQAIRDPQRRRLEADLAARVEVVFRKWPELSGFTVQAECPVLGHLVYGALIEIVRAEELVGALTRMLIELVDEEPEARALVVGRTFAR